MGFNWIRIHVISPYVNSRKNILLRKIFAIQYVDFAKYKIVVPIDESGFQTGWNAKYAWVKRGSEARKTKYEKVKNVTLI